MCNFLSSCSLLFVTHKPIKFHSCAKQNEILTESEIVLQLAITDSPISFSANVIFLNFFMFCLLIAIFCTGLVLYQVFDQYLNFVSLEDDLFCLCHQNSDRLSYYGKCVWPVRMCGKLKIGLDSVLKTKLYKTLTSVQMFFWQKLHAICNSK